MQLNYRNAVNFLILIISMAACWFTANVINPELHYYIRQSAFLTDSLFFQGFTRYPGGLSDYLSEFIAQFFYYKSVGSILIVLVASLQGILAINLIERIAGKVKLNFSFFALILLLSILAQSNYYYPFYASVRLLITSIFVWAFTVLTLKFPRIHLASGFLLATLLFYLAGGAALFVFALSVILIQIRFSKDNMDLLILPLFVAFAGIMLWIAYKYIFLVDKSLVYSIAHSKKPMITSYTPVLFLYALYSLLPAYILIAFIFNKFHKKRKQIYAPDAEKRTVNKITKINVAKASVKSEVIKKTNLEKPKLKILNSSIFLLGSQFAIILLLAVLSLSFMIDIEQRKRLLVSFYGANGDWDNVVKTAESLKEYDLFTNVEYNKALANTGKLSGNLFNYKQLAGSSGLFLDGTVTSDVPFICCDQYYDLGFIYESQHWAFEAQTIFPNSPRLMKRLVQINVVHGKYKLAEKFLQQLDKNMLYHRWVANYQKYIDDTTLVAKDPDFSWKRKCEPIESFTAKKYKEKLSKLLEANPSNKMAFEYLICSNLLDGDLGTFESRISENKIFPMNPLPQCWEEAYILYCYMSRKSPTNKDIKLTKPNIERFNSFVKAITPFGNNWQSARQSLQKEYGATYWYYLKCLSPKVTKVQIKQHKFDD